MWGSLTLATREVARSGDEERIARAAELLDQTRRALFGLLAADPAPDPPEEPPPAGSPAES